jgi:hypothetical protein
MRTTRRWALGLAAPLVSIGAGFWALADEPPPVDEPREPFSSPLTDDEAQWLIDEAEGRRFRDVPGEQMQRFIERQAEAVRESLGGSVIREFPSLGGEEAPPRPWRQRFRRSFDPPVLAEPPLVDPSAETAPAALRRGWGITLAPTVVVPATAIEATADSDIPVATLRIAAEGLDQSANRLEELQLYEQADDMRTLAQKLRVDARRLAAGREPLPQADSSVPDDSSEDYDE